MKKFYYQVKKENDLGRISRMYGWVVWIALAFITVFDTESSNRRYFFRILFYVLLALFYFPWKKYIEPFIELDDIGIATVLPYGQELTKLSWKDVTKVFYTTDGGISFYHGSDFTFFIPLSLLTEEDKISLIDTVKQKLNPSVMGLDKL